MNRKHGIDILKQAGYKYTGKREDILHYFEEQDGYRTAKDLLSELRKTYNTISFDTIYRNLHLFVQLDILEETELEGEKHFRIKCVSDHHHHFICRTCGLTKEVHACPMQQVGEELTNFAIENHKFEIYGTCPACIQSQA
ncbi:Fur family transcriptional regulator [Pontibacillus salicampi]|uniref:Fur family transcriptional regulator n=1 Tax=Pontibacillus salicampi TaxID=1449801 RepID=A0ABV6LN32_9BACI